MIAVARKGEASIRQVAKDFGISEACLHRWLKIADREDGVDPQGPRAGGDQSAELREAHKRSSSSSRKPRSCGVPWAICPGASTQNDVPADP